MNSNRQPDFQSIILFQYLTQPPCLAIISSYLCYSLRIAAIFSMFSLPLLNLSLAVFRSISFMGGFQGRTREKKIQRVITIITVGFDKEAHSTKSAIIQSIVLLNPKDLKIAVSCGEYYWKFNGITIPDGQIPYCIGNLKGLADKSNTESLVTGIFEVITILSAFLLMAMYERENRLRRSYDVSVNLTRRQLISTMRLFLPYSLFHGFCFLTFSLVASMYRELFIDLEEPWYSAGSVFIFIPQYFTMISPWILYWIVVKSEKNRISKTNNLIEMENRAENIYFDNYRQQWDREEKSFWKEKLDALVVSFRKFNNRRISFISNASMDQ